MRHVRQIRSRWGLKKFRQVLVEFADYFRPIRNSGNIPKDVLGCVLISIRHVAKQHPYSLVEVISLAPIHSPSIKQPFAMHFELCYKKCHCNVNYLKPRTSLR